MPPQSIIRHIAKLSLAIAHCLALAGCKEAGPSAPGAHAEEPQKLLIIGQDLGAIRGYLHSDCCPQPDGLTAYVDFYDVLKDGDFGGLGIDANGDDAGFEFDWGAGPVSAYRTATEFGIDGLAIGLSITENEHPGQLARLAAGELDENIGRLALFLKGINGPVYLRIGYEFDGAWNQGYEDPELYKAAFRRIVDVLRQEKASNFQTVWQAGAAVVDEVIDSTHEDISAWYPGDEYVDWMGFSWFMNPHETIQVDSSYDPGTPLALAEELLAFARARAKPVMIAEASPQAMDLNEKFMANHVGIWDGEPTTGRVQMTSTEIWDYWFAPLFELLHSNQDTIRALAYINADWDSQAMWGPPYESGFWGDTRLETNEGIAALFTDAIRSWKEPGGEGR